METLGKIQLSIDNYLETMAQVDSTSKSDQFQEYISTINQFTDSGRNWELYHADQEIKEAIDTIFEAITLELQPKLIRGGGEKPCQEQPASEEKPAPRKTKPKAPAKKPVDKKATKKPATKNPKSRKTTPKAPPKSAIPDQDLIFDTPDVGAWLTSFLKLDGKTLTGRKILSLYSKLLKYIHKYQGTWKTNPLKAAVEYSQNALIRISNEHLSGKDKLTKEIVLQFTEQGTKILTDALTNRKVRPSVALILQFKSLQDNSPKKEEVKIFAGHFNAQVDEIPKSDPFFHLLQQIRSGLDTYLHSRKKSLALYETELSGIACACEQSPSWKSIPAGRNEALSGVAPSEGQVISSVANITQNPGLDLPANWQQVFGTPEPNFKAMIYGLPGHGKSTLTRLFAGYYARNLGTVLYHSYEEPAGQIKRRFDKLGLSHPNIFISTGDLPSFRTYDLVIIDSVSRGNWSIPDFRAVMDTYSDKAMLFIFHATKDGKYKGYSEAAHDVDVVVKVQDLTAEAEKNRFGPLGAWGFEGMV